MMPATSNGEKGMDNSVRVYPVPICVDPASGAIEVTFVADGAGRRGVLYRLHVDFDTFSFPIDSRRVHHYGDQEAVSDCSLVLTFDGCGRLTYIYRKIDFSWSECRISEDFVGRAEVKPSVRMRFNAISTAERFCASLSQLMDDTSAGAGADVLRGPLHDLLTAMLEDRTYRPEVLPMAFLKSDEGS